MTTTGGVDVSPVLREQFQGLDVVGADIGLGADRQRQVLLIGETAWIEWSDFRNGGPLPAHPVSSVMLQRVGAATYRLARLLPHQTGASQ